MKCFKCNGNYELNFIDYHYKHCNGYRITKRKKTDKRKIRDLKKSLIQLQKSLEKKNKIIENAIHNKVALKKISTQRKYHPIYDSLEWKKLRYATLRKFNFKCLACNSTNKELHVDHIKPHSIYPSLAFDENNLQVLCKDCNLSKSNKFEDDLINKTM